MENIDDLTEPETNIGEDTFTCPKCGQPQTSFIDRGHGWTRCPGCDTGVQKRVIPEEYHHLIKKVVKEPKEPKEAEEKAPAEPPRVIQTIKQPSDNEDLFNRPQEDWQILGQVLKEFNVPITVVNYITKRAKRSGSMDPNELSRALSDLKSKLSQKEITYVTEEYYEAITAERERRREDSSYRPYPKISGAGGGTQSFPWHRGSQTSDDRDKNLPLWERDRRAQSEALTPADFERMWNERVEKVESKKTIEGLQKTINDMGNMMMGLEQQIKNPPKKDDSDKFYKIIMDKEEKSNERLMTLMAEMQKQRDLHGKELIELYKTQATRTSTEGYKEDGVRLAADALNSLTGVIQTNKPLHTMTKTLVSAQGQSPQSEPVDVELVDGGDLGILSKLPKRLVEED